MKKIMNKILAIVLLAGTFTASYLMGRGAGHAAQKLWFKD